MSCRCLCPIHWSYVLSREWSSWSSANRRCSNYIWVISNYIAYQGVTYIRVLTVNGVSGANKTTTKRTLCTCVVGKYCTQISLYRKNANNPVHIHTIREAYHLLSRIFISCLRHVSNLYRKINVGMSYRCIIRTFSQIYMVYYNNKKGNVVYSNQAQRRVNCTQTVSTVIWPSDMTTVWQHGCRVYSSLNIWRWLKIAEEN